MLFDILAKVKKDRREGMCPTIMNISTKEVGIKETEKYLRYRGYKVKTKLEGSMDIDTGIIDYDYWKVTVE